MNKLTLILAASLTTLSACKEKTPDADTPVAAADPSPAADIVAPDWTYTGVKARVEKLPDTFGDLMLHHEHIPSFVAPQSGKLHINKDSVTGMKAMIMPFEPADGVDTSGLKVGDIIAFDLAVWGSSSPNGLGFKLTGFAVLPAETELDFTDKPSVDVPVDDGP